MTFTRTNLYKRINGIELIKINHRTTRNWKQFPAHVFLNWMSFKCILWLFKYQNVVDKHAHTPNVNNEKLLTAQEPHTSSCHTRMRQRVELLMDAVENSLFQLHAPHFVDRHALVLVQIWLHIWDLLTSLDICKQCQIFLYWRIARTKKRNENEMKWTYWSVRVVWKKVLNKYLLWEINLAAVSGIFQ